MSESNANPMSRQNINRRPDGVYDSRGRKLEIGDECMLVTGFPQFFRVVDIRPALDPKLPPGTFHVELACAAHFWAPKGIPQAEFIRVRTVEEAGPMGFIKAPDMTIEQDPRNQAPQGPEGHDPEEVKKVVIP